MRGLRVASNCEYSLSHGSSNALQRRCKLTIPTLGRNPNRQHFLTNQYKMDSTVAEEAKWSALRVRKTFLDFYEKNGHTFGEIIRLLGIYSRLY